MKKLLLILLGICCTSLTLSLYAQQTKKEKVIPTEETLSPEIQMYVSNNTVYVKNASVGAKLRIYSIVGNKVCEIEITNNREFSQILNLPNAIYIFRLEGTTRKFVIR